MLNQYQILFPFSIVLNLMSPSDQVTWSDIGGLEEELDTLKETVIMPILHQDIFNKSKSKLLSFPKGTGPDRIPDWLITSHVTKIRSSDWLFT